MRRFLLLGLLLLTHLSARGQTATVSGALLLPSGAGAGHSYMRFQLMYCGGNSGTITGVGTISTAPFDVQTTNGVWSSPIYGNDVIFCGTASATTRWRITPYINGAAGPALTYWIHSGAAFAVAGAPACPQNTPPTISCVMDYLPAEPPPAPTPGGPVASVFGLTGNVCPPASLCTVNSSKFDLSGSTEVDVPTPAPGDNSTKAASTAFVVASEAGFGVVPGTNVIQTAIPPGVGNNQNPFGIASSWTVYNPAGTGPSSNQYLPGSSILVPCASWTLSLWQGTGVATQAFKMQIYKVAPGSLVVLATAKITFGGLTSPSFSTPGTVLVSDTISFPISPNFDYYVVYDTITGFPSIAGSTNFANNLWITTADNYGLAVSSSLTMGTGSAQAQKTIIVRMVAQS